MINWKLRLKNRYTLTALIGAIVACIYQICGVFGVIPAISESDAMNFLGIVVNVLAMVGIVVDPTTAGVGDSYTAMGYENPKEDDGVPADELDD